jgi:hypothetical protein
MPLGDYTYDLESYCNRIEADRTGLRAEVDRLKDIIEHNNDLKYLCDLQAENGGVRAEVERLERYITEIEQDRDGFERACVKALNERDHLLDRVITDEQIDKAWACAADANSYGNDAGLVALAEAGIVECPECEGEGRVMDAVICDRCEGHKWIREEK